MLSWLTVVELLGLGGDKRSYTFCHNPPHLPPFLKKQGFRGKVSGRKKKKEPVFARGTFRVLGERDNNYTTETPWVPTPNDSSKK